MTLANHKKTEDVKVLLVGNYPNDGQESMRRFADLLAYQLPERGVQVQSIAPQPVFGRFGGGMNQAGKWLGYLDKFLLFPRQLRQRVRQLDPDSLVHICDHSNAVYTSVLAGVAHLVTCHDLLAIRSALGEFPGRRIRATGRQYQKWILQGLNAARSVACISGATRVDLLRLSSLAHHQTTVIHNGLNHPYSALPAATAAQRLIDASARLGLSRNGEGLKPGFILHVGGNQWYKNRPGVLQIYARVLEEMPDAPSLVMVGKPFTREMHDAIKTLGLKDRVIELTGISNDDLMTFYCAAGLLLFPSFEEGFGWPIAEAQACGCRVVIVDRAPMSEIGGDAAFCFKLHGQPEAGEGPMSRDSLNDAAGKVMRALTEGPAERQARVDRGLRNALRFSADRMIEKYVQLYHRVLELRVEEEVATLEPLAAH